MNISLFHVSRAALALGLVFSADPALAQAPVATSPAAGSEQTSDAATRSDSTQLGDIIVTARRVAENLQAVPVSVTAYSGESLQQQNARAIPDAALLTPSLNIAPAQINASAVLIQMRGQVQSDVLATLDPSVGTYVDGVYWARAVGLNSNLLDVQSFQALKGPQGTLFGRNTSGGAILITTNDPKFGDGLSGSISGTYGNYNYQSLTAILNAPLIEDKLAVRLAYVGNRRDGYAPERNSGQKLGDLNDYTMRGKILIQPTETFRILLSGERYHSENHPDVGRPGYFVPDGRPSIEAGVEALGPAGCAANFAACTALGNQLWQQAIDYTDKKNRRWLTQLPFVTTTASTYSATVTQEMPFGEIKAIGAYRKMNSLLESSDQDAAPFRILDGTTNQQKARQWTGEVIASGKTFNDALDFAVGGFLFDERGFDRGPSSTFTTLVQYLNPNNPSPGQRLVTIYNGDVHNSSWGIFGQGTWHLNDALSLTGGLRYSKDKKSLNSTTGTGVGTADITNPFTGRGDTGFICQAGPVCPDNRSNSFSSWSYTAAVDYQLTDDILVYAKTAKGYRAGGQNLRGISAVPVSQQVIRPETAFAYEAGIKSELFNRRVRFNLTGYYTKVKDVQRSSAAVVGTTTASFVENAATMNVYGVEAEASALLPGGFQVDGTLGYTDPSYGTFIDINGVDRRKEIIPYVSKWTASISPQWKGEIGSARVRLRADFAYRSSQAVYNFGFYTNANGVPVDATNGSSKTGSGIPLTPAIVAGFNGSGISPGGWLVNARAGLTLLDGNLDLALWGKNITNRRDVLNGLVITGLESTREVVREPRTYGATATVKF